MVTAKGAALRLVERLGRELGRRPWAHEVAELARKLEAAVVELRDRPETAALARELGALAQRAPIAPALASAELAPGRLPFRRIPGGGGRPPPPRRRVVERSYELPGFRVRGGGT
jgi:hypothetical protein